MIFILGYGFLGKSISDFLALKKMPHFVASRKKYNSTSEYVHFIDLDLSILSDILNESSIIIHTIHPSVPFTSLEKSDDEIKDFEIKNEKLLNLFGIKQVKKVIYISSGGAIYGNPIYLPVKENHPCTPLSPYGKSKLTIESQLKLCSEKYNLNYIIIRPSNVYGKEINVQKKQGLINYMLCSLMLGSHLHIWGDGNGKKDYLYVEDFNNAILKVVMNNNISNQTFNLSSGEVLSVNQILEVFKSKITKEISVIYENQKSFDVLNIEIDSSEFRNTFDWKPEYKIEQAIDIILKSL